jgi:TPR repeat protein
MFAMARLMTALIVVASLFVVPASAQNFNKGYLAYSQGDFATALREWLPLARRGFTLAQYNLGRMYFSGEGVDQDYKEANKWFNRAATQQYPPAQNSLGILYNEGLGVRRDHAKATNWFRHGAEQGYTPAQISLGLQYAEGLGIKQDYTEAMKWFNIAAELGEAAATSHRDAIAGLMTPEQIDQARRTANLWLLKNRR